MLGAVRAVGKKMVIGQVYGAGKMEEAESTQAEPSIQQELEGNWRGHAGSDHAHTAEAIHTTEGANQDAHPGLHAKGETPYSVLAAGSRYQGTR